MTLTKAMKDEIIGKLLNKALPMEGLEKLKKDLKNALEETGTCPGWDAARETALAYPEFCGRTKQVSLDYVFRSEYSWRNEAVKIELDTPYALEVEENRYARGALAFSTRTVMTFAQLASFLWRGLLGQGAFFHGLTADFALCRRKRWTEGRFCTSSQRRSRRHRQRPPSRALPRHARGEHHAQRY